DIEVSTTDQTNFNFVIRQIINGDRHFRTSFAVRDKSISKVFHEEDPSPIEIPPTISITVNPTLEEVKKHGANPKNKGISLRSSDSLFGFGIGANLLGVHAGAGIGHGRGGYGDLGQGTILSPSSSSTPINPTRNATIGTSNVLPSRLHKSRFQLEISLNSDIPIYLFV
ncbi:hypothetical protein J6590_100632, partial [Homalodisca vitripennis]